MLDSRLSLAALFCCGVLSLLLLHHQGSHSQRSSSTSSISKVPITSGNVVYASESPSSSSSSSSRVRRSSGWGSLGSCSEDSSCSYILEAVEGGKTSSSQRTVLMNLTLMKRADGPELFNPVVLYMQDEDVLQVQNRTDTKQCLFYANVVSMANHTNRKPGFAIVNLCQGMFGTISLEDGAYFVEPVRDSDSAHLLYKYPLPTEHVFDKGAVSLADNDNEDVQTDTSEFVDDGKGIEKESGRRRRRSNDYSENSIDYFVEVLVVADVKMRRYHKDNLENYILTLFSTVATIYRHSSLEAAMNIIVVKIIVLDERSGPVITKNAQQTLKNFCSWQQHVNEGSNEDSPNHHDVAILLTREDICRAAGKCDTLGLAELGTMCDPLRSCAIIEDNGLSSSFTIAHELGHIFNIPHDDEKKCKDYANLQSKQEYHIMAPTLEYNTNPWSWSRCSSIMLHKFLDSHRAGCLIDKPVQRIYWDRLKDSSAPGISYSVDDQCQLVFGVSARRCPYMPTCQRLWCATYHNYQVGCRTQHMPWADGTPCNMDGGTPKWCMRGQCVGHAPVQWEPRNGNWGEWAEFQECSMTCGGGVRKAIRRCTNPEPAQGGRYCIGRRVRYKPCNTQECPWDTPDAREVQCSKFDNNQKYVKPGVPRNVQWVPKYTGIHESEQCKLYCRVKTRSDFYLLEDHVLDGTPCGRYTDDLCVAGNCRKAGCDRRLGSIRERDKCGVCGGNNSTCESVSGTYNGSVTYGYNHIIRIPAGATNIDIRQYAAEQKEDGNYVALTNPSGGHILNGNWLVDVHRKIMADAGTVFEYSGSQTAVERVNSSRPTRIDIHLQVLSIGLLSPPNIHYTWVKSRRDLNSNPQEPIKFYYKLSEQWTPCSSLCQGKHSQLIVCVDSVNENAVDNRQCANVNHRPQARQRVCNIHCQLRWESTDVSECHVTSQTQCGAGEQDQSSICVQMFQDSNKHKMEDAHCLAKETKPPSRKACFKDCAGRQWTYTQWAKCSVSCDGGRQAREAICVDSQRNRIHRDYCQSLQKDETDRKCNTVPCPKWIYYDWNECTRSCDGGFKIRQASCQDIAGHELARGLCNVDVLDDRRECNTHLCTSWSWSDWSACSATCSNAGQQIHATRTAQCMNSNNKVVKDKECDIREKILHKICRNLPHCPDWTLGEWSQCSKTCGEGWKTRTVRCVDGNDKTVDDSYCLKPGETVRPASHHPCSAIPHCPFWRAADWAPCTTTCGEGQQERSVDCVLRNEVVDKMFCAESNEPSSRQKCKAMACPVWEDGPWESCSVTCGKGNQTRRVFCRYDEGRLGTTTEDRCNAKIKPIFVKECVRKPCPVPREISLIAHLKSSKLYRDADRSQLTTPRSPQDEYKWIYGHWTDCSTTCGSGVQRRQVVCLSTLQNTHVRDEKCLLNKPPSIINCTISQCGQWKDGPWKQCSATCGRNIIQNRSVRCVAGGNLLDDSNCDLANKPVQHRMCILPVCPVRRQQLPPIIKPIDQVPEWSTGPWEQCTSSCGSGWSRRTVECKASKHSPCDPSTRPNQFQRCHTEKCPLYKWTVGPFDNQCSVSCGGGVERRRVFCAANGSVVEQAESNCNLYQKPSATRPCNTNKCLRRVWTSGKWSQCSTTCGRGSRHRDVHCVDADNTTLVLDAKECDVIRKPPSVHKCRMARCPKWRRGKWSLCSVSCGVGIRTRNVLCYKGRRNKVADTMCAALPKPQQSTKCAMLQCPDYRWFTSQWTRCSKKCEEGKQAREVYCVNSYDQRAPPRMCQGSKPPAVRSCISKNCPYHWKPAAWSTCSKSCDSGEQFRSIHCRIKVENDTYDGPTVPQNLCSGLQEPKKFRSCSLGPCESDTFWKVGEWHHCSETCGQGTQLRRVRCVDKNGNRLRRNKCTKKRPRKKRKCFVRNCEAGNCAELKQFNNQTFDGDNLVLVNGYTVQVYCHEMGLAHPKTYINLDKSGANYAEVYGKRLLYPFTCPDNGDRNDNCQCSEDGNPKTGKTEFLKIRVDLLNMKVDIHDYTFTRQVYGAPVPFGSAGDCYSAVDCPQGKFHIDLRNSKFIVSDDVRWVEQGHRTTKRIIKQHNNAVIDGACGGYCGQCSPDVRGYQGLKIQINPSESTANNEQEEETWF